MERHDTVPASAILAPEVLQGFSGAWAAQYGLDNAVKATDTPKTPAQVQRRTNHLGQPGMGEIDFRPYDWGTTRHGKYGPSLLGHPISFEVVGPTAKSPQLFHQWVLTEGVTQDTLTIDAITWRSTTAVPEALFATVDEIPEIYGIGTIPEEGLYLVISMTGSKGDLDDVGGGVPGTGGLGDGIVGQQIDGLNPRTGIKANGQKSKYEIFRVADMDLTSITLAADKRIGDYFTVPGGTAIIRAITLIKPVAARLVAVPGSGEKGKEQVFAFVPPEEALTPDILPPYATWTTGFCDPWLGYNLSASTGLPEDYDQKMALPVPKPIRQGTGRLTGIFGEAPIFLGTGRLALTLDDTTTFTADDLGKVIRIYSATQYRDGNWSTATVDGGNRVGDPDLDRLLGYWVIEQTVAGPPNRYSLRMAAQFDPPTGVPFYGSCEFMNMAQADLVGGKDVRLQWTMHDPVSSLWLDRHLLADKLDSARLTDIIDPAWVKPSMKNIDLSDTEGSPSRPDRVAFNTTPGEDPGSLLDLGFRPVFYPPKVSVTDPSKLVPDFDNPVYSNEVVLDPTVTTEKQFMEVDYSAGLVMLSHPPKPGFGCQLCPDSLALLNVSNRRREMVFFASFVPFSREPGQRSVAPRVTGGQVLTRPGSACEDAVESADVYGTRLFWPLADAQTITAGTTTQVKLDVALTAIDLPPTGFVEIVSGNTVPSGSPAWVDGNEQRVSTFGYTEVVYSDPGNGGNTTLNGCFGGGINGVAKTTSLNTPYSAVLRRDVVSPNKGNGTTGTDFQSDTTYGSSKRGAGLRFKRATTVVEPDGSLTVDTRDPLTLSHQALFSDLFSSWVIYGGEMTKSLPIAGHVLEFTELTVVIEGIRTVLPPKQYSAPVLGLSGSRYIYIDATDPACPVYAAGTDLPLPDGTYPPVTPHHVLIGQYSWVGGNIVAWYDLRQPMSDIDKRLDVTVGQPQGHDQPGDGAAHFTSLADAVEFVSKTMRPYSGLNGKYRRIKVIGPTLEDNAKLPIRPLVSGLIIEGASRCQDGSNGAPQEITWTGDTAPALFDISGCDGLVIRDVNFRFIDSAVSAVPRERCLFTADETVGGQVVKNVLIENVTLNGPAHGFFYCNDDIDANTGFDGLTFRNCKATDLTDFGVWCDTTIDPADNLLIDGCHFEVRKSTDVPGPELALGDNTGVVVHPGGTSYRWTIRKTYLHGGRFGIYLGAGSYHTIQDVNIAATDKCGVVATGPSHMVFDHVQVIGCYTVAGAVFTAPAVKVGVFFNTRGEARMSACRVGFSPHLATDYSVYTQQTTGSVLDLDGCLLEGLVQTGPNSVVRACHITEGLYVDDESTAAFNYIEAVLGSGNLEAGVSCILTGNIVEGVFNTGVSADNARMTGNLFQGAGTNSLTDNTQSSGDRFTGEVQIGNDCIIQGSWFTGGLTGIGAVTGVTVEGCQINYTASSAMTVSNSVFTNNKFGVTGADRLLDFDGLENSFIGNQFSGNVTALIRETAASTDRTALLVQGNLFRRTGVAAECGLAVYGNYCTVEGNLVEGVETGLGVSGIQVSGPGGSPNVGSHNTIIGNILGRAGTTIGLGCNVKESVITGNRVFGTLQTGSTTTNTSVTGNTTGEEGVSVGTTLSILGGGATGLTVSGNVTEGIAFLGATNSVYAANRVSSDTFGAGSDSTYSGNYLGGQALFSADKQVIDGNEIAGVCTVSGDQSIFSANDVLGVFTVSGTECLVSGCHLRDEVSLTADDITVTGNVQFGNKPFTAQYNNLNLKDNTIGGTVVLGGVTASKLQNVVGNHFQNTVSLGAFGIQYGNITGNTFDVAVSLAGGTMSNMTISGNVFKDNFNCPNGQLNIFSGNRCNGDMTLTSQDNSVVQGNLVWAVGVATGNLDLTASSGYVCTGNLVEGDLLVDDSGGAGGAGVVVGNKAAVIATDHAPNAGTVVVGNRTTNAGGNTNFNTAPGVGPIINHNVEG